MKKIAALIALAALLSGCAYLNQIYPKPPDPVCSKPEYAESVICAIAKYLQIEAEQMDDMLLDATLLPVALKQAKAEQMKKAIAKVRKYVVEKDVLTMAGIKAFLVAQAEIDPALALMLSRRLPMFTEIPVLSVKIFLPVDKALVIAHLDHQEAQFKFLAGGGLDETKAARNYVERLKID